MAKSQSVATLDLARVADEVNVILTEVYGKYVAQGSPTKLGGLRFLDVESSKTFAFEKTKVEEGKDGNLLLVLSAPAPRHEEATENAIRQGPFGDRIAGFDVRGSSDVGKADKKFLEVSYRFPVQSWLTDEQIVAYAQTHHLVNAREAMVGIIKENLLPMAAAVMENLITELRKQG